MGIGKLEFVAKKLIGANFRSAFCPVTAGNGRICFVLQQQGMGGYVLSCNSKGWEDMFCPVTARNYLVGFETRNISYV